MHLPIRDLLISVYHIPVDTLFHLLCTSLALAVVIKPFGGNTIRMYGH